MIYRNTLEQAYICLSKVVNKCLDSSCDSLFDFIPGLRSRYPVSLFFYYKNKYFVVYQSVCCFQEILHYSKVIRTTDDLHRVVSLYKGETELVRPLINDFICPRNKVVAESFIADMEANITQFDYLVDLHFPEVKCRDFMHHLQKNGFTFLRAFYDAKGPEDVYL